MMTIMFIFMIHDDDDDDDDVQLGFLHRVVTWAVRAATGRLPRFTNTTIIIIIIIIMVISIIMIRKMMMMMMMKMAGEQPLRWSHGETS